jgi:SAM-dependent methyltransferase
MAVRSSAEHPTRTVSYGQERAPTPVDRLGVWLSAVAVRRSADFTGARFADLGCGFSATFARTQLERARSATLVDVALAPDLARHPKVTAIEGSLADVLPTLAAESFDVTLCLSVLEHLPDPEATLRELRRVTAPGGVLLVNVPTWRGKRALEFAAFRLGVSPADEMNDHKRYYDPKDLWPLLVAAGFRPSDIRCRRHKLGLNTFAVCRVPPGESG